MASKSEISSPWFKYGTDKSYQNWCRTQPSAVTGRTDSIVYAHFRTAANAGIGIKPVYSGIPLNFDEHNLQHQIGQYSFRPKAWWEETVLKHLWRWVRSMGK